MEGDKSGQAVVHPVDAESIASDDYDVAELGYKPELQRRFKLWHIIAFSTCIEITFEGSLPLLSTSLADGGPSGLVYGFIFCWIGYCAVIASLAECVSMMPTAGGQYSWVYCLAHERTRKFASYITGFQLVCAWQADLAAVFYLGGTTLQSVIILNYPDYKAHRWHGTLLMYAVVLTAFICNTVLVRMLPRLELSTMVVHVSLFFVVLVSVTALGPHMSADDVFVNFQSLGNYSPGLGFFIGTITPVFGFLGADGAIHMCEEVRNPRTAVPTALMASLYINGAMAFAVFMAILFRLGDIQTALQTRTGFAYIEVFQRALRSTAFATVLVSLILFLFIVCSATVYATASRALWSFARDNGLPASSWLKKVHAPSRLPLNAIITTAAVSVLLGLINIGSAVAFSAILSLTVASFFGTYAAVICLVAWRRIQGIELPPRPWKLGRKTGLAINLFALAWLLLCGVFSFFPVAVPVTPASMNWGIVLWSAVMLFGTLWYAAHQRRFFTGPNVAALQ